MQKEIINSVLLIFFIISLSCSSVKGKKNRYLILSKDKIDNYYVYKAFDNVDSTEITLLSERTPLCESVSTETEIDLNDSYNFNLLEIANVKTKEGILMSLVKGLKVDGVTISEKNRMPFLISESCNGFLH
ncbi:MAG: hypothetical protein AAF489_06670 [Bacteroidota bacterium]